MSDESYEDGNGNVAAILVGEKEWSLKGHGIVEDLDGKKLVIVTDQGTNNIDFEVEEGKILINNNYYVIILFFVKIPCCEHKTGNKKHLRHKPVFIKGTPVIAV